MSSRLIVNSIRHTGASSDAITFDNAGKCAFPNNTGNILQVVSTTKTDHFTSTSASQTEITGLNVSITPSSSSNKILLLVNINFGAATNGYIGFNLKRDSTLIATSTAVSGDDRLQGTMGGYHSGTAQIESAGFNFLDSPSTTSAITYKTFVSSLYASVAVHINRTNDTGNSTYNQGVASTITVMEVAA